MRGWNGAHRCDNLRVADVRVLDGGLATELEARGHVLDDALWSARLLHDDPGAILDVHRAFVAAGADGVISASYQATLANCGAEALSLAVELARDSGARFVAASVGPYGAPLADHSEYTGAYGLDESDLAAWHEPRLRILEKASPDWLACETIPSWPEARALASLVQRDAWIAFQCRDGEHIADGTPIRECAAYLDRAPFVRAIGVNCTHPRYVTALLEAIRAVTSKPLVVYPNAGERYTPGAGWVGDAAEFLTLVPQWVKLGARLVGGCCRVSPDVIAQLARLLRQPTR